MPNFLYARCWDKETLNNFQKSKKKQNFLIMAVQRAIITRFDAGCTHNIEDPYENLIFSMKFGPRQYPQNYEALTTIKRWRRLRTLYSGNLRKNQFKKQLSGTIEINLTSDIIKHYTKRLKTLEIVFF